MKRRTEITIETQRTVAVRRRPINPLWVVPSGVEGRAGSADTWCQVCGDASRMVTPSEAASLGATSTRAIYRLIEAGDLHYTEAPNGPLLVCLKSLARR